MPVTQVVRTLRMRDIAHAETAQYTENLWGFVTWQWAPHATIYWERGTFLAARGNGLCWCGEPCFGRRISAEERERALQGWMNAPVSDVMSHVARYIEERKNRIPYCPSIRAGEEFLAKVKIAIGLPEESE